LTHDGERGDPCAGRQFTRIHRAEQRDRVFFGALEFGERGIPGFGAIDQRIHGLAQIAVALLKRARDAFDRRRGRRVGDIVAAEFCRDKARGGGVARQIVQRRFALRHAVLRIGATQQGLRPRLVRIGVELEELRAIALALRVAHVVT
jgi:hypothetical protein